MPDSRSIIIVEEALHTLKGHWFEYVRTIVDSCRRAGDSVVVVAHREADPRIRTELNARPLLPASAWDGSYDSANPLKRYLGALRHNWLLYRAVDRLLSAGEKCDCLLAPTILIHHLLAWVLLAYKYRGVKFQRMVLILINSQGSYQGPGRPVAFSRHPKTTLFRFLLRRLRPLVESGEVVLASETAGMAREYREFSGLPFRQFAHPVAVGTGRVAPARPAGLPLTFSCLGFARHEKGSDLLQKCILAIRERRPDLRIRFLIQWLDDFVLPDGSMERPHPGLVADPEVIFIDRPLDAAGYGRYLEETDGMVLPYRARSYYARVSRVAIEAAMMGIPLVYTRHTWLDELVSRCGAGVPFEDENLESLIAATMRLAEEIDVFRDAAGVRSAEARRFHSPETYRAALWMPAAGAATGSPAGELDGSPASG